MTKIRKGKGEANIWTKLIRKKEAIYVVCGGTLKIERDLIEE